MIWHIVTREFFDHLNSLRFALTTFILVALMVTNAVVHLQTHPDRVRDYSESVTTARNAVRAPTQLYLLLQKGPGDFRKRPSPLAFVADGGEALLPGRIWSGGSWSKTTSPGNSLKSVWWMGYPHLNLGAMSSLRPTATKIDWVFIITYLLSFLPLMFTFDALSGEREQGTLRLCLANPISRHALLLGKFIGALFAVLMPFYFAVLLNLAILSTDTWIQLDTAAWGRLGLIVLIASCYAGIFIAVGLIVSAATRESRLTLILLLLIWVTIVVFMPSTLGTLAAKWMSPVQTQHQFNKAKEAALAQAIDEPIKQMQEQFEKQLLSRHSLGALLKMPRAEAQALVEAESAKVDDADLPMLAALVMKDVEIRERFNREHLAAQSAQVLQARAITRLSPAATVQYALESLAGTGFNRHLHFLDSVRLHIRQFREFIAERERADATSLHLIGIPQGMSEKPVPPQAIPIFEDTLTFRDTLNTAMGDILLLVLLLGGFLLGAFLVFVRSEV